MTADEGIDVSEGTLTINPGRGGNGGRATVDADVAGNAGCPGNNGQAGTATGGRGGNNEKRLFVRGDVAGLENVIIGPLSGGNGGTADVVSCAGGSGLPCCDGGTGGAATSTGGAGGAASLVAAVFGVTTGAVTGGNGGEATSFANDGGDGGSCKLDDGGNGGNGGASTATGGTGGAAVSDGGGATGGNGGDASAFGGDGANGGDSGLGSPGSGGDGGVARATEGAGGAGTTAGTPGTPVQLDGIPGTDGGDIDVVLYCLDLRFLVLPSGLLDPGTYEGPVTDADTGAQIGVVSVTLANEVGGSLLSSTTPVEHIGLAGATLDVDVTSLQLEMPTAGVISGLQINPLYGTNVSSSHPLEVQALNAAGTLIDSRSITTVPDNSSHTETPTPVNAEFDVSESVATFRVVVDPQSFVTLFRIYLVDP